MQIDSVDVTIQHRFVLGADGRLRDVAATAFGTIMAGNVTVSFRDARVTAEPVESVGRGDMLAIEFTTPRADYWETPLGSEAPW